jgi:hypothetical protein
VISFVYFYAMVLLLDRLTKAVQFLLAKRKGEKKNEEDYVYGPGTDDGAVPGCLRRRARCY